MEGLFLSKDIMSLIDRHLTLEEVGRLITVTKNLYRKYGRTHPRVGCFAYFYIADGESSTQVFAARVSGQQNNVELYTYLNNWIRQKMDTKRSKYALALIFGLFQHTKDLKTLWNLFYPLPYISCKNVPAMIGEYYAEKNNDWMIPFDELLRTYRALRKSRHGYAYEAYISEVFMWCGILCGNITIADLQFVKNRVINDKEEDKGFDADSILIVLSLCTIIHAKPEFIRIACRYQGYNDDTMNMLCFELCKRQGCKQKVSNDFSCFESGTAKEFRKHIESNPEMFLRKAIKYGNIPMIREIRAMMKNKKPTDRQLLGYQLSSMSAEFVYDLVEKRPREEAIKLLKVALNKKNKKSKKC